MYNINTMASNISTIDPIIDRQLEYHTIAMTSGASIQIRPYPATNFTANGGTTNFNISVPSKACFTDKCVQLEINGHAAYVGTTTPQFNAGYDALRANPINSCIINTTFTIGNQSISQRIQEVLPALMWYHDNKHIKTSPTYQDRFQLYSDGVATNKNSLGLYENTSGEEQRGAFPISGLSITSTTAAGFDFKLVESLFMSPFEDTMDTSLGFSNIPQMSFEITWGSLDRMLSHTDYPSQIATSATVTFLSAPILWMRHVIPKVAVPRQLQYKHQQIVSYPTLVSSALVPNASATVVANNIQVDRVPSKLYLYACLPPSVKTYSQTDTFLAITNVSVQFDNIPNQLSNCSVPILYQISKENGCRQSYAEFAGTSVNTAGTSVLGTTGSVFCAKFGTQIMCQAMPNEVYATNLQVQATIKNVNQSDTLTGVNLYVVVVYDLKIVIGEDGVVQMHNGIDHSLPSTYKALPEIRKMEGGSILSDVGKFAKEDILPMAKEIAPIVLPLVMQALMAGAGSQVAGAQVAGQMVAGDIGGSFGGKGMSEKQLLEALKRR